MIEVNKKKRNIIIISSVTLLVCIIVLFFFLFKKEFNFKIDGIPIEYTNESIIIIAQRIEDATYSFNNEDFTTSNTLLVEENRDNISIRIKLKNNKIKEKNIKIDKIDKGIPIVSEVKTNYNDDTKTNIWFEIEAHDDISGIKEYIYKIDGVEYKTESRNYKIPEIKESISIVVRDNAYNEVAVDERYYKGNNNELEVMINPSTMTNKPVNFVIVKKQNYQQYSVKKEGSETSFQENNVFTISENGTYLVEVKTSKGLLSKTINFTNIDIEKPNIKYTTFQKEQKLYITLEANDNISQTLLYKWSNEEWTTDIKKEFKSMLKDYVVKVKDEAGNESYIVINESFLTEQEENKKPLPSTKPEEKPPNLEINYLKNPSNKITLEVLTDEENLVSYQNGPWVNVKTIVITENYSDYSIRVKNKLGIIAEKKVVITNIIKEKTIEEQNKELMVSITNTYGFRIDYGPSAGSFWYNGSASTILTDHIKANQGLKNIITALPIFPKDFFRTFQGQNGYRITFYDAIPGNNVAGVASYEFGDDNRMILDVNAGFVGRTFYHETWHIMENYIKQKNYGKPDPFSNWSNLNPPGFSYHNGADNTYTVFDFDKYKTEKEDISFITSYAKTDACEDRAEIYTDLMFRVGKKDYMQAGFGVNEKAKQLSLIIRNYFPNSKGAAWERWITW